MRGSLAEDYSAFLSVGPRCRGSLGLRPVQLPGRRPVQARAGLLLSVIEQERQQRRRRPVRRAGAAGSASSTSCSTSSTPTPTSGPAPASRWPSRSTSAARAGQSRGTSAGRRSAGAPRPAAASPAAAGSREQLGAVRGLLAGASPTWIAAATYDAEQAAALAELLAVHQGAQRHGYFGAEPYLTAAVVRAIAVAGARAGDRRRGRAGRRRGPRPRSRVSDERGQPRSSTSRRPTTQDAEVRLGVVVRRAAGTPPRRSSVLGEHGHGVALWLPGETPCSASVTLARLTARRPAGAPAARQCGTLVVPATGARRPGRRATCRGCSGTCRRLLRRDGRGARAGPAAAGPDGHLGGRRRGAHRLVVGATASARTTASTAWPRPAGCAAGVRRPADERALLDALELDEDQRTLLCRSHRARRGSGRAADVQRHGRGRVRRGGPARLWRRAGQVEIEEIGGRPDYREAQSAPVIHFAARADAADGGRRRRARRPHRLARPRGDHHASTASRWRLPAPARGADPRRWRGSSCANGVHVALDHPEFQHLAELVDAAARAARAAATTVSGSATTTSACGTSSPRSASSTRRPAQWVRAAQALRGIDTLPTVEPVGVTARAAALPARRVPLAGVPLGVAGSAASSPTTWGSARRCRRWRWSPTPAQRGAAPFLVVAPTSVVSTWAHEAAAFTPGLDRPRRHRVAVAPRRERSPTCVDGADVVVTSYTLYRLEADDYVAQTWGGLVLDEAQTVKNHQSKTYQAVRRLDAPFRLAHHRHADGEPADGAVVAAVDRRAGPLPYPQQFTELVAVPVEKLGDARCPAAVPAPDPAVPAAAHQGPGRRRPAAQAGAGARGAADPASTGAIYDTHLQRERQNVLGLLDDDFDKHRIAIFRSLTRLRQLSLDAALVDEEYDGVGSAKIDVLGRPPARGPRRGTPGAGVQPVHVVPHPGAAPARRRGHHVDATSTAAPATGRGDRRASSRATPACS